MDKLTGSKQLLPSLADTGNKRVTNLQDRKQLLLNRQQSNPLSFGKNSFVSVSYMRLLNKGIEGLRSNAQIIDHPQFNRSSINEENQSAPDSKQLMHNDEQGQSDKED